MGSQLDISLVTNMSKARTDFVATTKDINAVEKAFDKGVAAGGKLERQAQRSGQSLRGMGGDANQAAAMLNKIAASAAGILSVSAALNKAKEAMAALRQESKQAAADFEAAQDSTELLLSLSDTVTEFGQLKQRAKDIGLREGLKPDAARRFVFTSESAGFTAQEEKYLASLSGFTDPEMFASTVKSARESFRDEAGSAAQISNKLLAASQDSRAKPAQIATALEQVASSAADIGLSDEETLAALAHLGNVMPPDQVAPKFEAFASEAAKRGFEGRTIAQIVGQFNQLPTDELGMIKASNKEFRKGFNPLSQGLADVNKFAANIERQNALADTPQSMVSARLAIAENDPAVRALRDAQRAQSAAAFAGEEKLAQAELQKMAMLESRRAAEIEAGASMKQRMGTFIKRGVVEHGAFGWPLPMAPEYAEAFMQTDLEQEFRRYSGRVPIGPQMLINLAKSVGKYMTSVQPTGDFGPASTGIKPIESLIQSNTEAMRSLEKERNNRQQMQLRGFD